MKNKRNCEWDKCPEPKVEGEEFCEYHLELLTLPQGNHKPDYSKPPGEAQHELKCAKD